MTASSSGATEEQFPPCGYRTARWSMAGKTPLLGCSCGPSFRLGVLPVGLVLLEEGTVSPVGAGLHHGGSAMMVSEAAPPRCLRAAPKESAFGGLHKRGGVVD